jgi:putative peptidoglycan lipid II flippase
MSTVTQFGPALPAASVNRRILSAAVSVSAAGVLVKAAAVFKETVVAGIYGRSDELDSFLTAALIPGLLINLISESMNQALIPTLIRVREQQGMVRAQELLSNAMVWVSTLLCVVSVAMGIAARAVFPLLASSFAPAKLDLAVRIFHVLLPVVVISGISTNCTAVLNTLNRFAQPALAPLVISLITIAGAVFLNGRFGIWALVYGSLAGALVHALWVAGLLSTQGFHLSFRWYGMSDASREVVHLYGPVLVSGVVASAGLVVDQAMAAMLPAGSVSALAYASRFVSVVLTLLAGAISTAVTPHFSQMIAVEDWAACKRAVYSWARWTALVSVPIAALLVVGSRLLIRLTLQHGAFAAHDTAVVSQILVMYSLQIPFFVSSRVYYRYLVAMRRTDLILYCGIVNLILDVGLNLTLMHFLGIAGIALATSIWTASTYFFLRYWAQKLISRTVCGAIAPTR